jgi:dTDP-4-amino-4,6-dideoxygalactose transaminase
VVCNGTDALQIALRALGLEPGDEVITTPFSFYSAAESWPIWARFPVFSSISKPTPSTSTPVLVEAAITPRTRAIIPVTSSPSSPDEPTQRHRRPA